MIYLDSSALLKLLFAEVETPVLSAWLAARAGAPLTTSELARVEVVRACRRTSALALAQAAALLSGLDLMPITRTLIDDATLVGDPSLRSLDALHLASALSIRSDLSSFVAYNRRLSAAAAAAGIDCVQPGA